MDWPLDNTGLSDSDFNKVFRYAPQDSTVFRFLTTDQVCRSWRRNYTNILTLLRSPNYGSILPIMIGGHGFKQYVIHSMLYQVLTQVLMSQGVPSLHENSGLVLMYVN
jgi:hypothetical protein